MKQILILTIASAVFSSCGRKIFATNGETIYRTGRNLNGEKLLDRSASEIRIIAGCQSCHGKNADRIKRPVLKFSYLSNPANFSTPYNDTLFYRFLDKDLKGNGTKANIGVIWKMSDKDKKDLLDYLKTM